MSYTAGMVVLVRLCEGILISVCWSGGEKGIAVLESEGSIVVNITMVGERLALWTSGRR